ncbi:MAG: hypothetical protein SFU25_01850 [Candidatus Caenarcaniphilales bacterium]|nr:hypothetical protein [Candidatus Caenarcaniphilales bacterium]
MVTPVEAYQHPTVLKIIKNADKCLPNIYFTKEELISKERDLRFLDSLPHLLEVQKKGDYERWYGEMKDMSLVPLNRCVVRGNKNYFKDENKPFLKVLNVQSIVNLDFIAHTKVQGKTIGFNYVFVPMNPSFYPRGESMISFLHALTALSQATPESRIYLSCFHGKHRSSLLSAVHQFLLEYARFPEEACKNAAGDNDPAFIQAVELANEGILTYNMPKSYKDFYADFTKAVCKEKSGEFLDQLL